MGAGSVDGPGERRYNPDNMRREDLYAVAGVYGKERHLPSGIHAAPLAEVLARFGIGSEARERQAELLRLAVEAAAIYPAIKRILVWGSFVTTKPDPADPDYSMVVSVAYDSTQISRGHRRFFVPLEARLYYGIDRGYLVIHDYPLDLYVELMDFLCRTRDQRSCGVVEISLRGEVVGGEA